ncbi:hypothetical protein [Desulfovibrio inopinatus]|uniref:hypothetical protein n=1 Tax=Desulfovibrio inopinatus TaxID=102109 RepID=UPI000409170F|nr:hypothetical protein [Desulfovibrio inopinatus]
MMLSFGRFVWNTLGTLALAYLIYQWVFVNPDAAQRFFQRISGVVVGLFGMPVAF